MRLSPGPPGGAGHVALHVGDEHGDAGARELLGQQLQRLGLAGAGRAGDQPVPVHRREWHADRRVTEQLALVDAAPEVDGFALGRVGLADRLREVRHAREACQAMPRAAASRLTRHCTIGGPSGHCGAAPRSGTIGR